MRVAWTERQQLDGPGRWRVAYGIDCKGRRIRRLVRRWISTQEALPNKLPSAVKLVFGIPNGPSRC